MAQLLTRTSVSDATTVRVPPPPSPNVMKDNSVSSATFKPAWSTAVASTSYVQLGVLGVSAAPLNLVEKPQETSRKTITEEYKAWEANKTSGNLDKTEVKETASSPELAPSAETAYSINPGSLNVPSVRNMEKEEFSDASVKVDVPDDPIDGMAMPSHLKSFPGIAMFFEMVDSSNTRKGIEVSGFMYPRVSTLKLTPNPETLTINSTKKIGRYATMSGWVEEHWGDDIDVINFTGSTFSLYDDTQDISLGLTNEYRDQTKSYLYLKELVKYFQVNGCLYQGNEYDLSLPAVNDFLNHNPEFLTHHPRKGMIKERLYIKMNYDYLTLYGRFDSFDIIEDSSSPFKFKYSAVFKAEKTIYNLYAQGGSI